MASKIVYDVHTNLSTPSWRPFTLSSEEILRRAEHLGVSSIIMGDKIKAGFPSYPFASFKATCNIDTKVVVNPFVEFLKTLYDGARIDIEGIFVSPFDVKNKRYSTEEALDIIFSQDGVPVIDAVNAFERSDVDLLVRKYIPKHVIYFENVWLYKNNEYDGKVKGISFAFGCPVIAALDTYGDGLDKVYNLTEANLEKPDDVIAVLKKKAIRPVITERPSKSLKVKRAVQFLAGYQDQARAIFRR